MILKIYKKIIKFFNLILYIIIYKPNYKFDVFLNKQEKIFEKYNLNRNKAIEKLNFIKEKFSFISNPMSSSRSIVSIFAVGNS